jgi:hypothetical protein
MVERRHQTDLFGKQHAVAEHVARHVAHARNRERLVLDIHVEFAEMPLHGLPRARAVMPMPLWS